MFFLSAYKVFGLDLKQSDNNIILLENNNPYIKAVITRNIDDQFYFLDRQVALSEMLLIGGISGLSRDDGYKEKLDNKIQYIQEKRKKSLGRDCIIVIELRENIDAEVKELKEEFEDFIVCFNAYNKEEQIKKIQDRIAAILAAVRIAGDTKYEFQSIADGSYLIQPDGKIIHSFSIKVSSSVYICEPVTESLVEKVKEYTGAIIKDDKLAKVTKLFASSLDKQNDNFKAFIHAWSALEIFINKIFPKYNEDLISRFEELSTATGLRQYLKIISKDKYTLVDKFSVISIFLEGENETDDIEKFKKIKDIRDKIFHGEDITEGSLPIRELQLLFEKYFRSHITRA